jgi:hypothetical protein
MTTDGTMNHSRPSAAVPIEGPDGRPEREAGMSMDAPASKAAEVEALAGRVGRREFEAAADHYKPALYEWVKSLSALDDRAFEAEAAMAILGSAVANSWSGNWEHEHFKASACHFESNRRKAEAHDEGCEISTLYERAYNSVVRSQGHSSLARDIRPCSCSGTSCPGVQR